MKYELRGVYGEALSMKSELWKHKVTFDSSYFIVYMSQFMVHTYSSNFTVQTSHFIPPSSISHFTVHTSQLTSHFIVPTSNFIHHV